MIFFPNYYCDDILYGFLQQPLISFLQMMT